MNTRLSIKLSRFGKKRQPIYRFAVLPVFRSPSKKFALEYLGWYNPRTKEAKINQDRLNYYLEKNVLLTPSVKSVLAKNSFLKSDKESKPKVETKKKPVEVKPSTKAVKKQESKETNKSTTSSKPKTTKPKKEEKVKEKTTKTKSESK